MYPGLHQCRNTATRTGTITAYNHHEIWKWNFPTKAGEICGTPFNWYHLSGLMETAGWYEDVDVRYPHKQHGLWGVKHQIGQKLMSWMTFWNLLITIPPLMVVRQIADAQHSFSCPSFAELSHQNLTRWILMSVSCCLVSEFNCAQESGGKAYSRGLCYSTMAKTPST